jgi:hypothetical protein
MYLPGAELQQYRGQLVCPYCIQDMRDEDRRSEYHEERPRLEALQIPETCERCGRDLEGRVYIWNGKKLCYKCVGDEQQKWGLVGGGPMGAPAKITLEPEKRRRKASLIESVISDLLHAAGVRKKPGKVEVIEYKTKMPIQHAKPMSELPMKKKEETKPVSEGIMKSQAQKPFQFEKEEPRESFFEEEKPKRKRKRKKSGENDPFFEFSASGKKKK